ncbi:TlpA family protein disulfide reductase [Chitinophaga sp. 22321]|uniref:TlpA family protein disulfide reductase n=1 Tax=Chitinophaga hostae TaxID=2831022 RepID=A0ABS5J779_9BACT|nr:TlpA disulfide reductase family protein [Chitinophaga hostae]MBS0031035.1 TlpA family protein disulfide reductase [Chitinophaga hostae]
MLIILLYFSSCSKRTITFTAASSLFDSTAFHPQAIDRMSILIDEKNGLSMKEISLTENSYTTIYERRPITFRPMSMTFTRRTASPGDTLSISENEYGILIYRTTNPQRNTALFCINLWDSLGFATKKDVLRKYYASDTLSLHEKSAIREDIKQHVNTLSKLKRKILDSLAIRYSLSSDFLRSRRYQIESDSLSDTYWLYDRFLKPIENREGWLAICRTFCKDLGHFGSTKGSFFYFRNCADRLLYFVEREHNIKSMLRDTTDFINHYNSIANNFSGAAKDYLLSVLMHDAASKRMEIPENYIRSYFAVCGNRSYKFDIRDKLRQQRKIGSFKPAVSGNDVLSVKTGTRTTIEDIIKNEKGNIILIDFWASWCVPCREEFPFLKTLSENYKGKKIKFIKISLDKDIEKWKSASRNEGFTTNNYVLVNAKQSKMIAEYNIQTIPRFMLINGDGEMITPDAPRPSDSALKILIEKYLASSHKERQ